MPKPRALTVFDLYELAVTNAGPLARFLHAAYVTPTVNSDRRKGGTTKKPILREDFCGSAALARGWANAYGPAIAADIDAAALHAAPRHPKIRYVARDCYTLTTKADIIAATNFPLGYCHTRSTLLGYLRNVRTSLKPGGIFAADMYGGSDTFQVKRVSQRLRGPRGEKITYTWEQRSACPLTSRVLNALHFTVKHNSITKRFDDAFTYDWRIWSIAELCDAFADAGFSGVDVFDRLGDAVDNDGNLFIRPLSPDEPMDDPYVVYIVARK